MAYPFADIEKKWNSFWEDRRFYRTDLSKKDNKYYSLMMFPYPSGDMHVGHGRNYILGDAVFRYKKMKGFNVLTPMGWDAFGLPAENAAIKNKVHPREWTVANIAKFKSQFRDWGISYDWDRELAACHPGYYKWTQYFFTKFFEHGLAYKKKAFVNWCPSCQTVLANEQVVDKACERCDTPVVQKDLEQWFFRITDFAEELLADLDTLTGWPERVKIMQKNWIGLSEGVEIDFPIEGHDKPLTIFTTRPDTAFGVTFAAVAPEHPIVKDLIKDSGQRPQLEQFIFETVNLDRFKRTAEETEKKGVFTGRYAINPLNGTKVPIYLANFVLMEYGTGAIMAVPAHDQRDFEFAKKYGLPIRVVIQNPSRSLVPASMTGAYVEEGVMSHSGAFDGLPSPEGLKRIASWIEEKKIGRKTKHTRLRDWLISRQRYWGAPIPIIYCDCCGMVPVPEKDLPVLLPDDAVFNPNGESPLKTSPTFSKTVCPTCGKPARRETDTMDTFVDSSWYFLRYLYPRDDKQAFGPLVNDWLPVDQYIGGIEHAILHLLYARFFVKALHRFGLVGFREPFRNLFTQGMIIKNGFKMSKSKGNVVNPKPLIEQYGADTVRLYTLFIGPPEKDAEWNDEAVEGASRFLNRFWYLCAEHEGLVRNAPDAPPALGDKQSKKLYHVLNKLVKKITDDIEGAFHFNTAISGIMELTNALADYLSSSDSPDPALVRSVVLKTTLCLSPFAPHICEELWVRLTGKTGGIMLESWPEYDPSALKADEVTVVFQVNGKIRSKIETASGTPKDELEKAALADPALAKWLEGLTVRKIVVIPDKLVNIVAT